MYLSSSQTFYNLYGLHIMQIYYVRHIYNVWWEINLWILLLEKRIGKLNKSSISHQKLKDTIHRGR